MTYWENLANRSNKLRDRERAQSVLEFLQPISNDITSLGNSAYLDYHQCYFLIFFSYNILNPSVSSYSINSVSLRFLYFTITKSINNDNPAPESTPLDRCHDNMEKIQDYLDDLWKMVPDSGAPYGEARMRNLLRVLGDTWTR